PAFAANRGRAASTVRVRLSERSTLAADLARWQAYVHRKTPCPLSLDPGWLLVLEKGLGHAPYVLEASRGEETVGLLFLAYVRSLLFGRFLVSLPYLNYGGVLGEDEEAAGALIDQAVALADQLDVRHLE